MGKVFISLHMCLSSPFSAALAARLGGKMLSACQRLQIMKRSEGFTSWPLEKNQSLQLCFPFQTSAACPQPGFCHTFLRWIYGPINGESLCMIKSRTDLNAIQFNNYLSNSIIFRYVVSMSTDLEDPLFTAVLLNQSFTHLAHTSSALENFGMNAIWSVCLSLGLEKDVQRTCTCTSPRLRTSPQASDEKLLPLCSDKWWI